MDFWHEFCLFLLLSVFKIERVVLVVGEDRDSVVWIGPGLSCGRGDKAGVLELYKDTDKTHSVGINRARSAKTIILP